MVAKRLADAAGKLTKSNLASQWLIEPETDAICCSLKWVEPIEAKIVWRRTCGEPVEINLLVRWTWSSGHLPALPTSLGWLLHVGIVLAAQARAIQDVRLAGPLAACSQWIAGRGLFMSMQR